MAARSVLGGRYAEASVGGVLIALLTDWSVKIKGKTVDLTANGDTWEYKSPLQSGWTFHAKGYVIPAAVTSLYAYGLWTVSALPVLVTVAGFSGSVATGTKIFEGQGYPVQGDLSAPMELAVQEFEIDGHGAPSVGIHA